MSNRIKKKKLKDNSEWIYFTEEQGCKIILKARELGMSPSELLESSMDMIYGKLKGEIDSKLKGKALLKELKKRKGKAK